MKKIMNIQTYAKNVHHNTTETKGFLFDYISTLLKRFRKWFINWK